MNRKLSRLLSMLVVVVLSLSAILIPAYATKDLSKSGDLAEQDYSFYRLASCASGWYANASAPGAADDKKYSLDSQSIDTAGNAGAVLGFYDKGADKDGVYGFILTVDSNITSTYSYQVFQNDTNGASALNRHLMGYCAYGYALHEMGFDKTGSMGQVFGRIIFGATVIIAYILAYSVSGLMNLVVTLLQNVNPFAFFMNVGTNLAGFAGWNSGMSDTFFGQIASTGTEVYNIFTDLGMAMIPIFIVTMLVSVLLLKKTNEMGSRIKQLVIRVAFIAIGIPLMGGIYTSALNNLSLQLNDTNVAANKIIVSSFVDFDSWAMNSNLSPSSGISIPASAIPNESVRAQIQAMNIKLNIDEKTGTVSLDDSVYPYLRSFAIRANKSGNVTNESQWGVENLTSSNMRSNNSESFASIFTMLLRYLKNDYCSPSSFESKIKAALDPNDDATLEFFTSRNTMAAWQTTSDDDSVDKFTHDLHGMMTGGCLDISAVNGNVRLEFNGNSTDKGLSDIAMYNYLNTSFHANSATVYAAALASSQFVRESHYQVNMIGTGMLSFFYWLNSFSLLICFAVVGWFYALAIVMANIKRGIRLIGEIPFAMLGSMKAIARVIAYTLMLITEVVATFFIYILVTNIIFSISTATSDVIVETLTDTIVLGNMPMITLPGYPLAIVQLLVSTVVVIWFTIISLRVRRQFVKAIDEEVARVVEKIIGVNSGAASDHIGDKPGLGENLMKGAAAGAGAALGAKLFGNKETATDGENGKGSQMTVGTGDGGEDGEDAGGVIAERDENGHVMGYHDKDGHAVDANGHRIDGKSGADGKSGEDADKEVAKNLENADSLGDASPAHEDGGTEDSDTDSESRTSDSNAESETKDPQSEGTPADKPDGGETTNAESKDAASKETSTDAQSGPEQNVDAADTGNGNTKPGDGKSKSGGNKSKSGANKSGNNGTKSRGVHASKGGPVSAGATGSGDPALNGTAVDIADEQAEAYLGLDDDKDQDGKQGAENAVAKALQAAPLPKSENAGSPVRAVQASASPQPGNHKDSAGGQSLTSSNGRTTPSQMRSFGQRAQGGGSGQPSSVGAKDVQRGVSADTEQQPMTFEEQQRQSLIEALRENNDLLRQQMQPAVNNSPAPPPMSVGKAAALGALAAVAKSMDDDSGLAGAVVQGVAGGAVAQEMAQQMRGVSAGGGGAPARGGGGAPASGGGDARRSATTARGAGRKNVNPGGSSADGGRRVGQPLGGRHPVAADLRREASSSVRFARSSEQLAEQVDAGTGPAASVYQQNLAQQAVLNRQVAHSNMAMANNMDTLAGKATGARAAVEGVDTTLMNATRDMQQSRADAQNKRLVEYQQADASRYAYAVGANGQVDASKLTLGDRVVYEARQRGRALRESGANTVTNGMTSVADFAHGKLNSAADAVRGAEIKGANIGNKVHTLRKNSAQKALFKQMNAQAKGNMAQKYKYEQAVLDMGSSSGVKLQRDSLDDDVI